MPEKLLYTINPCFKKSLQMRAISPCLEMSTPMILVDSQFNFEPGPVTIVICAEYRFLTEAPLMACPLTVPVGLIFN